MEAGPSDKPDGKCEYCGDPVRKLPATGKLVNMDGRSHDQTHVDRLRQLSLEICDALDNFSRNKTVSKVELDEEHCDGFLIQDKQGRGYWFRCTRMAPAIARKRK